MVGVTGTNGRPRVRSGSPCVRDGRRRAAVVGTLGNGFRARSRRSAHHADAAVLQETLARLKQSGATVVVMEVSSIGLDQGRVNGTRFDVALFTNLTRDHLDYHGTMAATARRRRSSSLAGTRGRGGQHDDAFGERIAGVARARVRVCSAMA